MTYHQYHKRVRPCRYRATTQEVKSYSLWARGGFKPKSLQQEYCISWYCDGCKIDHDFMVATRKMV